MTERTSTFNRILKEEVKPILEAEGFIFDRSRTFRKIDNDTESVSIINFQLGQRSLEGKFTVNLGFFKSGDSKNITLQKAYPHDCTQENETRIGLILPPKIKAFNKIPILSFFFGSSDKWWKFTEDANFTKKQLITVTNNITNYGVPWLYGKGP